MAASQTPEDWGLEGKVAVVTGGGAAGTGIGNGRAAAILLARAGTKVIVVDKAIDLAEQTVSMIEDEGGKAMALGADLTRDEDCAGMVRTALDRYGRLDFLDNNVGIGSRGSVVDESLENWRRVMQVNVETMFLASKHAIPALRPRGLTTYSASKGAVIALTRAMAVDHGREGVRVNCVAPGPVYTPMVYQRGMSPEARDRRRRASVLQREGTGWDIGLAVRFLLSDHARYITGHTLVVDGGATLSGPERASE